MSKNRSTIMIVFIVVACFGEQRPGLGVYKWSPEGLYDKCVCCIPNTDEILKLLEKKY